MTMIYVLAPFVAWLVAGGLKFVLNSARRRSLAFAEIGYGGFPSTHTSVVAAPVALIAFDGGWGTPLFSLALALLLVVIIDAASLRRQIGTHAERLNLLMRDLPAHVPVRERIGHRLGEILGGVLTGTAVAYALTLAAG